MPTASANAAESVPTGVLLNDAGRIDQDLWCAGCQYNVRTLHTAADCPECGTAVQRTIDAADLGIGDPGWLRRLWRGGTWFLLALAGVLVQMFVLFAAVMAEFQDSLWVMAVVALPGAAAIAFILVGFFWITTPEPHARLREPWLSPRRLARVAVASTFLLCVGWSLALIIVEVYYRRSLEVPEWLVAFPILGSFVAVFAFTLVHAARVAHRLGRRWLSWLTGLVNCMLLVGVMTGVMLEWDMLENWVPWGVVDRLMDETFPFILLSLAVLGGVIIDHWLVLRKTLRGFLAT